MKLDLGFSPDYAFSSPEDLRLACRAGQFDQPTAGQAPGYIQANLMVVPHQHAYDFLLFCNRNPKACPLIEVLERGCAEPRCAVGANITTDAPGYRVYRDGQMVEERDDIAALWRDDMVGFLIGCSFSFESALMRAGISLRHIEEGSNVAMYRTSLPCKTAGVFRGQTVVSMRPIRCSDVSAAVEISSQFPQAHGTPIHVGSPASIGIRDLSKPDYGDPVRIMDDELPVFWACGVTPQWVAQCSRLSMCITHAPGKMFVTDLQG